MYFIWKGHFLYSLICYIKIIFNHCSFNCQSDLSVNGTAHSDNWRCLLFCYLPLQVVIHSAHSQVSCVFSPSSVAAFSTRFHQQQERVTAPPWYNDAVDCCYFNTLTVCLWCLKNGRQHVKVGILCTRKPLSLFFDFFYYIIGAIYVSPC